MQFCLKHLRPQISTIKLYPKHSKTVSTRVTTEITSLIPAHTLKCPMCSKTFGGTILNNVIRHQTNTKDRLKNHIGFVHFGQKIKKEIERLFEGNKCTVCMKDFVNFENKGKHLIYNHIKYVEEIQSAVGPRQLLNH